MSLLWGIDLGGTKIEGVVLDSATKSVLTRLRLPTGADRGYDHIVGQIEACVAELEGKTNLKRPATIGIGTPGAVDPATGLMKNCNTTALNGRSLPSDLERTLATQVAIANDANCFALAEARLGAGRGAEVVFGVIMGTGVGGGIVVRGRVLNGAQGIAGEWGHNLLEPDGEPCYCGKRGCVETVLAGPALERFYERRSGHRQSLASIAAAADTDPDARATVDRLLGKFGEALSVVIDILDPQVVILGGGVGNIKELQSRAIEVLTPWVFSNGVRTQIVSPKLGDSAGVFGAAMLTSDWPPPE